jgi:hypothetical protein
MNQSSLRFGAFFLTAAAVAGCGISADYVPLAQAPHAPVSRPASAVELFTTGAPNRGFVEVGIIEVQQQRYSGAAPGEIIEKLREVAGENGCDGLVLTGPNDAVTGSKYGDWTLKGYRGTCIVYTEGSDSNAAAAAAQR